MDEMSTEELQALALRVLGRKITEAQAKAYRPRLPTFAWAVERLQAFDEVLGDLGPATVFRPKAIDEGHRDGG